MLLLLLPLPPHTISPSVKVSPPNASITNGHSDVSDTPTIDADAVRLVLSSSDVDGGSAGLGVYYTISEVNGGGEVYS